MFCCWTHAPTYPPLSNPPPLPSPSIIGMCWLCVLQVRAASTVTSWSNQTPTALPNVPLPLQVGNAPEHKVQRSPAATSHTPLQMRSHDHVYVNLIQTCLSVFPCSVITVVLGSLHPEGTFCLSWCVLPKAASYLDVWIFPFFVGILFDPKWCWEQSSGPSISVSSAFHCLCWFDSVNVQHFVALLVKAFLDFRSFCSWLHLRTVHPAQRCRSSFIFYEGQTMKTALLVCQWYFFCFCFISIGRADKPCLWDAATRLICSTSSLLHSCIHLPSVPA